MKKNEWANYIHINCRTCAHSTPKADSTWHCERHDAAIAVEYQHQGCESHTLHPDLVPWKMKDSGHDWVAVYEIDGHDVENGEPCANVYSSKELLANVYGCTDPLTEAARKMFPGARVVK